MLDALLGHLMKKQPVKQVYEEMMTANLACIHHYLGMHNPLICANQAHQECPPV